MNKTLKDLIAMIMVLIIAICGSLFVADATAKPPRKDIVYASTLVNTVGNMGYSHIDSVKCIDKYKKGKWYAYYVCCDGDCYIITIKKGKTDVCVQLN